MSRCVRRRCSSSCQGVYGRPSGFLPRSAAGMPSTTVSNPTCASSQARRRPTCCRIASSEAMSPPSTPHPGTLAPLAPWHPGTLLLFCLQHPRRIPFDHVVDRGSIPDVADAVELIRRLENDRSGADTLQLPVDERLDRAFLDDHQFFVRVLVRRVWRLSLVQRGDMNLELVEGGG